MIKKQPEMDGQGNALRDYVWMGDIPVAMVEYTGLTERVTYLHADHLNTPRYATDETGTLVWQWSSDAFGNGVPNQDPDGDGTAITLNLRFPGQYYDAETGLHYNWNRYYDPAIGRYITSDPIGLDGGLNTFGYVYQNPLAFIDPFGLYGTSDCSYYDWRCRESKGSSDYYCSIAPLVCETFNHLPPVVRNNWSECVRECLQEADSKVCSPGCDGSVDASCTTGAHIDCWFECGKNPYQPSPNLPW